MILYCVQGVTVFSKIYTAVANNFKINHLIYPQMLKFFIMDRRIKHIWKP